MLKHVALAILSPACCSSDTITGGKDRRRVELPSVFAIKVRTQFISREDARLLVRQFQEDIVAQKFLVTTIREPEFAVAERLLEQYAFDLRLRALDAIQIAVALGLKSQGLVDQFVAADKVLCEVASLEGFAVLNPEHP
jgi:predicted nucleic acid-binding protein